MGLPIGVSSSAGGKENRPGTATKKTFSPTEGATDTHQAAHQNSDVDSSHRALHHTLGRGAFQSAPGNIVDAVYLVGEIKLWPSNFAPEGYIFLNGAELVISEFRELYDFAVDNQIMGSFSERDQKPFAMGAGGTTFFVPDTRVRYPLGNYNHESVKYIGKTEGDPNLVTRQLKQKNVHAHNVWLPEEAAPNHQHSIGPSGATAGNVTGVEGSHSHSVTSTTLTQVDTTAVGGTNSRLTGPATHSHDTGTSGSHSHSFQTSNHTHSTDYGYINTPELHQHEGGLTGRPQEYLTEQQIAPFDASYYAGAPYFTINYIMRYTGKLDFEGAPF